MEKAKKILKKLLIILICVAILLFIIKSEQGNKMQYMDGLNYDITLHENGDMTIVETWDIYINHTNTIFKNFEISDKFGEIKDVTVKDLGEGKNLTKIDEFSYTFLVSPFCKNRLKKVFLDPKVVNEVGLIHIFENFASVFSNFIN